MRQRDQPGPLPSRETTVTREKLCTHPTHNGTSRVTENQMLRIVHIRHILNIKQVWPRYAIALKHRALRISDFPAGTMSTRNFPG